MSPELEPESGRIWTPVRVTEARGEQPRRHWSTESTPSSLQQQRSMWALKSVLLTDCFLCMCREPGSTANIVMRGRRYASGAVRSLPGVDGGPGGQDIGVRGSDQLIASLRVPKRPWACPGKCSHGRFRAGRSGHFPKARPARRACDCQYQLRHSVLPRHRITLTGCGQSEPVCGRRMVACACEAHFAVQRRSKVTAFRRFPIRECPLEL